MDPNPSDSAVERANADFAGNAFSADSAAIDPKLVALTGRATVLYARKAYDEAAEVYAEACTLQEKLNGELAPENAELLYAYGRCLYHVAVSKSDVLGGKGVVEEFVPQPSKKRKATDVDLDTQEGESSTKSAPKKFKVERAAHFEITGDDNEWTESDDSDVANAEAQDQIADEQEDDFGIAWEILDMARCILVKRLEDHKTVPHDGEGKGKAKAEVSSEVRKEKEMLADTLDLQAEIALENERFLDAVGNSRESLALQQQLFPEDSNRIAEAHFKLSLALEFASVTQPRTQDDQSPKGDFLRLHNDAPGVDEAMRKDAAKEMQLSIVSTKLRLVREEESLARLPEGEASRNKKSQIEDVRGMLEEMEQRVSRLEHIAYIFRELFGKLNFGKSSSIFVLRPYLCLARRQRTSITRSTPQMIYVSFGEQLWKA